tara:strand:+ start:310 stop:492 length:183 start_codon:yes stop_codon:yes gene_type:complete
MRSWLSFAFEHSQTATTWVSPVLDAHRFKRILTGEFNAIAIEVELQPHRMADFQGHREKL